MILFFLSEFSSKTASRQQDSCGGLVCHKCLYGSMCFYTGECVLVKEVLFMCRVEKHHILFKKGENYHQTKGSVALHRWTYSIVFL